MGAYNEDSGQIYIDGNPIGYIDSRTMIIEPILPMPPRWIRKIMKKYGVKYSGRRK